jgi:hypothetical protein
MDRNLPKGEEPVFVEWTARVGGVRVSAWTDKKGNPYIGAFALNRLGKPSGLPCWLRRGSFESDIVIGFEDDSNPIILGIDTWLSERGLHLIVYLPNDLIMGGGLPRRELFAPWGDPAPTLGFIIKPTD